MVVQGKKKRRSKTHKNDTERETDPRGEASVGSATKTSVFAKTQSAMGNDKLDDMAFAEVFSGHPLVRVGKYVLIPYVLYLSYYYFQLQHPEVVSLVTLGLVRLRPAIYNSASPRQVLIVGTQGSGTVQMASTLKRQLGLEIEHESTDAAWSFARDGSVSWFHGIRFFAPTSQKEKLDSIHALCSAPQSTHENMGFHPAMYGPPRNKCSYRSKWNDCWKSECYMILLQEWACMSNLSCDINFRANLHQVRNPVHNIESLITKFCVGGLEGSVQEPFVKYASALFPTHDFANDSCIDAVSYFVVMYLEAMVKAREKGHIDNFYRVEDSSACAVVDAAGLTQLSTTVYEPNYEHVSKLCNESDVRSAAQNVVGQDRNKVNKGQVALAWDDFLGGRHGSKRKDGDHELVQRLKRLFAAFSYDPTKILDKPEFSHRFVEL
ncbi:hypothetical protein THAOC_02702 [Thalassiosira oceanica]|uniref:Uncharacterized protein n=1 Tax=Thalassiosira oceanica TaxID=159749 RepID=K0TLS6_THAOC|nr:hypothetical protein THAOC_02702 [Thalassiosira oceanica]|eukprot:EJK75571.1 hypothetical protein THAOC_02702 [Thalassiosira oceanica]